MMMTRTTMRRKTCEGHTSHASLWCTLRQQQMDEAHCTHWQPNAHRFVP